MTEVSWNSVAAELGAAHAEGAARDGRLDAVGVVWRSLPMNTGWLVWLTPDRGASGDAAARSSVVERLELVQTLRLAQISVWHVDLTQRWIHLDDVGYQMLGLTPVADGVSLDSIRAFAHPDDMQALARAAEEALAGHAVVDLEVRYGRSASSEYRRLLTRRVAERDADGRAIGLWGVSLEQTERIVERERAQALAQRIEMVADTAGVGIYSVNLASGEIEWNRQMYRIHGFAEGSGAPNFDQLAAERIHPRDQVGFERTRKRSAAVVEAGFEGEVRILHPDESLRWVEYRSRRERLGAQWYLLGIAIDVTGRVLQREMTEKSLLEKATAERANADKSAFLARMSHELRTPLNAVLGFAQLIEQGGAAVSVDVQRERVAHIRQAGEKLLALIGDVLDRVDQEGLTDPSRLAFDDTAPGDSLGAPDVGSSSRAASALTVLYIEDNPVNVILVEELVAMRANTTLHCAADGLSGVAWAVARQPDVVLVDMQLPDIDGFEVLRRLRDRRELDRSAIVALSANGISEDIALALAAGFDDYWTKPIDFRRFLSGLDKLAASRYRPA